MVGNSTIKSKYEYGIALQDAAHLGKLDDVKLLLNQGADVNVLVCERGTALPSRRMLP